MQEVKCQLCDNWRETTDDRRWANKKLTEHVKDAHGLNMKEYKEKVEK